MCYDIPNIIVFERWDHESTFYQMTTEKRVQNNMQDSIYSYTPYSGALLDF